MNGKMKEGVEHVSDKEEEGMEDDKGSYKASMQGYTWIALNVLVTLWTLIWASYFLLYFYLCPKTSVSKFFATINSFFKLT